MNTGKFIVIEGAEAGGKTTTLKQFIKRANNPKLIYNKGFTFTSTYDKILHFYPTTLFFMIDFMIKSEYKIKPLLREGNTVLQDRYIQSVASYIPDSKRGYNKLLIKVCSPLLIKPDVYIHFTVSLDERLARLRKNTETGHMDYHRRLIKNPSNIMEREEEYMKVFQNLKCDKFVIDTTNKNLIEVGSELEKIIGGYIKC